MTLWGDERLGYKGNFRAQRDFVDAINQLELREIPFFSWEEVYMVQRAAYSCLRHARSVLSFARVGGRFPVDQSSCFATLILSLTMSRWG